MRHLGRGLPCKIHFESFWDKHLKPAGVDVVFIMLDDFHYFPIMKENSMYLTMRAMFQELVNQKCNYSLVITAYTNLFTQFAEIAEPLLRFLLGLI